jgi:hypothetical protein
MGPDYPDEPSTPGVRDAPPVVGRDESIAAGAAAAADRWHRHVLYPNPYIWFVFLSALDVLCTYLVLHPIFSHPATLAPRGREVNLLARWVIDIGGLPGMVVYKFALVMLIVVICETVGWQRYALGKRLAEWCVAISAIPVVLSLWQMLADVLPWALGR